MIYKEIKSPITLTQGCMTQRGQGSLLASVRLLWAVGVSISHMQVTVIPTFLCICVLLFISCLSLSLFLTV